MPPKGKAPTPAQAQPIQPEEEDDEFERLEQLIATQNKDTKEAMERQQRLILQQREDARKEQQAMMKQMEELITNRLSPRTSINPTPSTTPPPPGEDHQPVDIIVPPPPPAASTYEFTRTPTIPSIEKLKGRNNYQTWTINIMSHARNLDIWSAIQGKPASQRQEDLAQSLIILNVTTPIQHQIKSLTAAQAWKRLEERYNTRNISQITKTVQELCNIHYDKFNSIETFQQRLLTLEQQITEFTTSPEEAFHVLFAALILNGIGKANNTIKGQIETSLNNEKPAYDDELKQHIFDKLFAFRNPHGSRSNSNINAVNNKPFNGRKDCKTCNRSHGPTCWVEHPEMAPKEKQKQYRELQKKLLSDKEKTNKDEKEDEPKKIGFVYH